MPHGPLFLVSFAALPDAQGRYLVERHTLSYVPSVGVLRYTKGHRPPETESSRPARLLVVGNPAMPRLPGRTSRPSPLPGAEAEALAISRLYPAGSVTTLLGPRAEERRVRELAHGSTIIHLATHGFIRDDQPLDSLLALAPVEVAPTADGEGDGLLTVRKIIGMDLDAQLVVLSACNSGLGRINGDGVVGLARAFLYAGSRSVLASLWRVADEVTSPQMVQFYGAFQHNGGRTAVALRRAQLLTLRGLRQRRYRTSSGAAVPPLPTFWASFILIGEPG